MPPRMGNSFTLFKPVIMGFLSIKPLMVCFCSFARGEEIIVCQTRCLGLPGKVDELRCDYNHKRGKIVKGEERDLVFNFLLFEG